MSSISRIEENRGTIGRGSEEEEQGEEERFSVEDDMFL